MTIVESSILALNHAPVIADYHFLLASIQHIGHQAIEGTAYLAQNYSEIQKIDIIADFQKAFTNFIESGQVWALGIGLVLGWVLHGFIGS